MTGCWGTRRAACAAARAGACAEREARRSARAAGSSWSSCCCSRCSSAAGTSRRTSRRRQGPARRHRGRGRDRWQDAGRGRGRARGGTGRPGRRSRCWSPWTATAARSRRGPGARRSTTRRPSAEAGGERSWDPQRLWDYYTGGEDLDPSWSIDETPARRACWTASTRSSASRPRTGDQLQDGQGRRHRPGRAAPRSSGTASPTASSTSGSPRTSRPPSPSTSTRSPRTSTRRTSRRRWSRSPIPALAGPVTLVFGGSPVQLARATSPRRSGSSPSTASLVPALKTKVITTLVDAGITHRGRPVDATVALVNGKPKVIPAKPGVSYEPQAVTDAFLDLVAEARRRALDRGRGHRRRAGVHHQGREGPEDQGAGLDLHDVLPAGASTATSTSAAPPS